MVMTIFSFSMTATNVFSFRFDDNISIFNFWPDGGNYFILGSIAITLAFGLMATRIELLDQST
jgi:hypothetical protein